MTASAGTIPTLAQIVRLRLVLLVLREPQGLPLFRMPPAPVRCIFEAIER